MTQVERLARELYRVGTTEANRPARKADQLETWESRPKWVQRGFRALARHVLRRERAARGRTLGYVSHIGYEPLLTRAEAQRQVDACGGVVARVVAVPRKGGRK